MSAGSTSPARSTGRCCTPTSSRTAGSRRAGSAGAPGSPPTRPPAPLLPPPRPAGPPHHLPDPSTGRPAYTGVVQATALAPTALEAELRAKCAVLSGPGTAADCLAHGGLIVFDDGTDPLIP